MKASLELAGLNRYPKQRLTNYFPRSIAIARGNRMLFSR